MAALLGALALPAGLLLLMGLPALATQWYAARHDVDLNELAARASLRNRTTTAVVIFAEDFD